MPKMRIPVVPMRSSSRLLIAFEALAVTLAVHAALYFLTGYQAPPRATMPEQESSVSFLSANLFSGDQFRQFHQWLEIHDPSLMVRSDNSHNYIALLAAGLDVRDYRNIPTPAFSFVPEKQTIPPFAPIAIPAATPFTPGNEQILFPFEPLPAGSARTRSIAFDENGKVLPLEPASPPGEYASFPTVIQLRRTGTGVLRRRLLKSSGNPELDRAAMQTLAGAEDPQFSEVTIYWPESSATRSQEGGSQP